MDETGSSKVEVFKECISRSWGRVRPLPSLKDRWHGALQASAVCKLAMVRGGVGLFAEKERGGKGMQPVRSLVHPSHPPPLDRHAQQVSSPPIHIDTVTVLISAYDRAVVESSTLRSLQCRFDAWRRGQPHSYNIRTWLLAGNHKTPLRGIVATNPEV